MFRWSVLFLCSQQGDTRGGGHWIEREENNLSLSSSTIYTISTLILPSTMKDPKKNLFFFLFSLKGKKKWTTRLHFVTTTHCYRYNNDDKSSPRLLRLSIQFPYLDTDSSIHTKIQRKIFFFFCFHWKIKKNEQQLHFLTTTHCYRCGNPKWWRNLSSSSSSSSTIYTISTLRDS